MLYSILKTSIAFQKIHSDFSFRTHDRSFSFVPVDQCGSSLQSNKVITICVKTSLSVVDNRNLEKTWELANDSLCVVLMNEIKKTVKYLHEFTRNLKLNGLRRNEHVCPHALYVN